MSENKDVLNGFLADTKAQIATFDQKAGILIATIGIIFALIFDFFGIFNSDAFNKCDDCIKTTYIILFIAYCLFAVFSIACFVLVIIPRKKPKKIDKEINAQKHINYYMDGAELSNDEFSKLLQEYNSNNQVLIQQVINNDKICKRKHLFLTIGIYGLIPFAATILSLILLIVFKIR